MTSYMYFVKQNYVQVSFSFGQGSGIESEISDFPNRRIRSLTTLKNQGKKYTFLMIKNNEFIPWIKIHDLPDPDPTENYWIHKLEYSIYTIHAYIT